MKIELRNTFQEYHSGYGAGSGNIERYEYSCPCGKGKILEEHDNIPGFRDHAIYLQCDSCRNLFDINTIKGVRNWKLDGFFINGITNAKIRLDESLEGHNIKSSLVNLFEFLSWVFAIREKCDVKKEKNIRFWALKDVLDILKHDYDLTELSFLIIENDKETENELIFGDISNILNIGNKRLERYTNSILNASVERITKEIFIDTIHTYNKLYV